MMVVMVVTMGRDNNDARPVSVMMVVMMVVMTELHRDLGHFHVAGFRIAPCILGLQRRHCVRHRV